MNPRRAAVIHAKAPAVQLGFQALIFSMKRGQPTAAECRALETAALACAPRHLTPAMQLLRAVALELVALAEITPAAMARLTAALDAQRREAPDGRGKPVYDWQTRKDLA